MFSKNSKNLIKKINYKDIIIVFGTWYFIAIFNFLIGEVNIKYTPNLSGFLHFSFIFTGRFLFLGLIIFYFISIHSVTFSELGLSFFKLKKQIHLTIYFLSFFLIIILLFINIPLSFNSLSDKFHPLFKINSPGNFVKSIIPLLLLFIPNMVIALSEQFILNNIVFELFNLKINTIISVILSSLFYSIIVFTFSPSQILINCIIALISIYLYLKANRSLYLPTFIMSIYYSLYIGYIYGWGYLKF